MNNKYLTEQSVIDFVCTTFGYAYVTDPQLSLEHTLMGGGDYKDAGGRFYDNDNNEVGIEVCADDYNFSLKASAVMEKLTTSNLKHKRVLGRKIVEQNHDLTMDWREFNVRKYGTDYVKDLIAYLRKQNELDSIATRNEVKEIDKQIEDLFNKRKAILKDRKYRIVKSTVQISRLRDEITEQ